MQSFCVETRCSSLNSVRRAWMSSHYSTERKGGKGCAVERLHNISVKGTRAHVEAKCSLFTGMLPAGIFSARDLTPTPPRCGAEQTQQAAKDTAACSQILLHDSYTVEISNRLPAAQRSKTEETSKLAATCLHNLLHDSHTVEVSNRLRRGARQMCRRSPKQHDTRTWCMTPTLLSS